MTEPTLLQPIDSLQRVIQGVVVRPGDAEYDRIRTVWNGMVKRRPAMIVRCFGARDVARAIAFARELASRSRYAVVDTTSLGMPCPTVG